MGTLRVTSAVVESLLSGQEGTLKTLSAMEKALEEAKCQLANQTVDTLLSRLEPEDGGPKPCPICGKACGVSKRGVVREFEALSGHHRIERNYHYCRGCERGFYPRDAELGLPPEGEVTYEMERRILDLAVSATYRECVERFEMHYGRTFSENLFRKVTERVGKRMGEADDAKLYALASPPPPIRTGTYDRLTVLNDGCMLPGLGGKWKEAKVAVMVRNDDVEASRYVAFWGGQDGFRDKVRAALRAERSMRYHEMVWIADGARSNWSLCGDLAIQVIEVLDWIHAVENAMKCGRALLGEQSPFLSVWQARVEKLLSAGRIEELISELMDCMELCTDDQLEALNQIVGYYRYNASRMKYPEYRRRGIPIGSGRVESAHRHVLQSRMKLAGQHWSEENGRRMVELRALYRTVGSHRLHEVINRAFLSTHLRKPRADLTRKTPVQPKLRVVA